MLFTDFGRRYVAEEFGLSPEGFLKAATDGLVVELRPAALQGGNRCSPPAKERRLGGCLSPVRRRCG